MAATFCEPRASVAWAISSAHDDSQSQSQSQSPSPFPWSWHYIPAPFGLYLAVGRVNEELASADLLGGYDG
ncbi:hypothetical protein, partial [Streptomyces sp. NPDC004435]|uniref:hypothetical protein n=1 Tax=Streptomyces sp. NPDC004435 TaxID=3364701 RepID=UPI0036B2DFA9